jgi:cytochrome d ubiquinol oxidase subunit I
MVGLGIAQLLLLLWAFILERKGTLFSHRGLLRTLVFAVAGPFAANQAGWVAAEVGRQPWVVYGLLRTGDALSKSVTAGQVMGSIIGFGLIYLMLFAVWVFVLDDKIKHGPDDVPAPPSATPPGGLMEAAGRRTAREGYSLTETGE